MAQLMLLTDKKCKDSVMNSKYKGGSNNAGK